VRPSLHLVDRDCIQLDRLFGSKCLSKLDFCLGLNSPKIPRRHKEPVLVAQELIMSSPNLHSLSLGIHYQWGGSQHFRLPNISTQFSTDLRPSFPPLKELTLEDYIMKDGEWLYWKDNFQWKSLHKLTLNQCTGVFLRGLAAQVHNLRSLEIMCFPSDTNGRDKSGDIDRLLRSFSSLETIKLEGHTASAEALIRHPALSDVNIHVAEFDSGGSRRPALSVADLEVL
jgi:hypothetical protein